MTDSSSSAQTVSEEKEGEVERNDVAVETCEVRRQEEEDEGCSDKELDELLNFSLGEFGKHGPASNTEVKPPPAPPPEESGQSRARGQQGTNPPPSATNTQDFEDIFSEEFAAQAQTQLGEAMKLLSKEDPQLWQQLQGFTDAASTNLQPPAMGGEGGGGGGGASGEGVSVEQTLEDTLRKLQESTQQIESSSEGGEEGLADKLSQLLGNLGEGAEGGEGEEGEEGLVKMMEGMMGTLLSRDVLYPSLTEICQQYPDWLSSHQSTLSPEDYTRYCKQLEIMRAICQEFEQQQQQQKEEEEGEGEGERGEGGEGEGSSRRGAEGSKQFDRILQLMQQLQQYGQPPPEIAGENLTHGGLPSFPPLPLSGGPIPADCSLM